MERRREGVRSVDFFQETGQIKIDVMIIIKMNI